MYRLAEHLKRSILFYESHQIREYHMHPAWVDPNSEYEDTETSVVEVHRLNRLNLHILLPEDLLHIWNDEQSNDLILEFFTEVGIISQKFISNITFWRACSLSRIYSFIKTYSKERA